MPRPRAGWPPANPRLTGVLILLPPSETKTAPTRGRPLDMATLANPALNDARREVVGALVSLCRGDAETARTTLGLSRGLADEVGRNALVETRPTTTAGRLYAGVLYDNLALETLDASAKRRAGSRLLVTSALFGLLRLKDRVPRYRLSGDASLPGIGTVASVWRRHLATVLDPAIDRGLVVDLRSGTYGGFWRPPRERAHRVVTLRVLHQEGGTRTVVSHFNKATKGRLVRAVLLAGAQPRTPEQFAQALRDLGFRVEGGAGGSGSGRYDVIVSEL